MAGYNWQYIMYFILFLAPWLFVLIPSARFQVLIRCEIAIGVTGVLTALYRIWQGEVETAAGWLVAAAVAIGFASMSAKKE